MSLGVLDDPGAARRMEIGEGQRQMVERRVELVHGALISSGDRLAMEGAIRVAGRWGRAARVEDAEAAAARSDGSGDPDGQGGACESADDDRGDGHM